MKNCYQKQDILDILYEHYKNSNISDVDINEDVEKLYSCRRNIRKLLKDKTINEKVLINNIVIAINAFGINNTNVILYYMLDEIEYPCAKSILIFLNCYNEKVGQEYNTNPVMDAILNDIIDRYSIPMEHL